MNKKRAIMAFCLLLINNNSLAMLAQARKWINTRFSAPVSKTMTGATTSIKSRLTSSSAAPEQTTTTPNGQNQWLNTRAFAFFTGITGLAGYLIARQVYTAPQTSPLEARKDELAKQIKFAQSTLANLLYKAGLGKNPEDRLKAAKGAEDLFNVERQAFGSVIGKPIQERFVEINKKQEAVIAELYNAQRNNNNEQACAAQEKLDVLTRTFGDLVPDAHTISSDNEILQSRAVTLNRQYENAREKYDNAKNFNDRNAANAELKRIGKEKAEIYAQSGTLFSGFASWLRGAVTETEEVPKKR